MMIRLSQIPRALTDPLFVPVAASGEPGGRNLSDSELLDAWFLTRAVSIGIGAKVPGIHQPGLSAVLREMLSVRRMNRDQLQQLAGHLHDLETRNGVEGGMMATRLWGTAMLARQEFWRYPVVMTDQELANYCRKLSSINDGAINAGMGSGIAGALAAPVISAIAGAVLGWVGLAAAGTSGYYGSLVGLYREEMLKRGLNPDRAP